jgi:formate hydrogenlyase transcriptional activator
MLASNNERHIPHLVPRRACDPLDVLRSAFGQLPNGVVVCADDGTILFVNDLAATALDYARGELIGQPLARLLPGIVPEGHDPEWKRFWDAPDPMAKFAGRRIGGMRRDRVMVPLDVSVSVLPDETTRYVIVSIADVTERTNLEARLAAATHAHLGFHRLVADVAVGFATLAPAAVDTAIVDALRQVAETLQLDSAVLWQWRSGEAAAQPMHYWAQEASPLPPDPLSTLSIPFVAAKLAAGESCAFATLNDLPESDRDAFRRCGFRSVMLVPLAETGNRGPVLNALALGSMTREQEWAPMIVEGLRLIASVIGQATARRAGHHALEEALDEIRQLRERMTMEHVEHRRESRPLRSSSPVISESQAIQRVLAQIDQVAPTPATVLLLGETGSGKELMAQAVHDLSPRHARQMIRVNCAAIPVTLIESELFGREKGAYTGALSRQIGRFEAAHQSTLFLDEVGELPMEVQVKLLRVLQERVIERLGSTQPVKIDVRIIAATNRNLEAAVRDKTFREDLFYRLNVFPVVVPPLRERVDDIPALVWSFVDEFSRLFGKPIETISKETLRELQRYPWPGNVRELRNVIERAVILATGTHLVVEAPRVSDRPIPQNAMTLTELEVEHIRAVLKSTGWRVRGSGGAAERLGVKPTTLESRMARLGIERVKAS